MYDVVYFFIVISIYHDEHIGKLRFFHDGVKEETLFYSLSELNNIIALWKEGKLLGSFGIGTVLNRNADFQLVLE